MVFIRHGQRGRIHDLTSRLPTVAHDSITGVECCCCVIAAVEGGNVELRCNECRAVVAVVRIDVMRGLVGLGGGTAKCPHCGHENVFPDFDKMIAHVGHGCERSAAVESRL